MNDWLIIAVVALLPITALITVLQSHPYHALISRGIMGAVAALIYAVLGAADVALTEALMGTLLTILLYAVAVRSSMVLRIGWMQRSDPTGASSDPSCDVSYAPLRKFCEHHHLTAEFHGYENHHALLDALTTGKIDAVYDEAHTLPIKERDLVSGKPSGAARAACILAHHAVSVERKMLRFFRSDDLDVCRLTPERNATTP